MPDQRTAAYQPAARTQETNYTMDSDLAQYLKEIGQYAILSAEEELLLARDVADGVPGARETFINHNLRLVVPIATHYAKYSGVSLLDLIQEGNMGLMHAVDKYDLSKGYRFSTYATWWIRQRISRELPHLKNTVFIPVHVNEDIHALKNFIARLETDLSREATYAEIADASNGKYTIADIVRMLQLGEGSVSLDAPIAEHSHQQRTQVITLGDKLEDTNCDDPAAIAEQSLLARSVEEALSCLNAKDRHVIVMRFGLDGQGVRTLEETAKSLGVVRERIRQRQNHSIKKLKPALQGMLVER